MGVQRWEFRCSLADTAEVGVGMAGQKGNHFRSKNIAEVEVGKAEQRGNHFRSKNIPKEVVEAMVVLRDVVCN